MTMTTKRTIVAASVLALGVAGAGIAPSYAGDRSVRLDTQKLDRSAAEFTQYRGYGRGWHGARGWHGGRGWNGRGAAVAGAVGLGILGAAAAAAAANSYAAPVYYDAPAYGYEAYPVYEAPPVVYRPYYGDGYAYGRGPYAGTYRGAPDPARGGR
jgi:hypothetical protein